MSDREYHGGYWSPNSKRIAFNAERYGIQTSSYAVAVMDADGSDVGGSSPTTASASSCGDGRGYGPGPRPLDRPVKFGPQGAIIALLDPLRGRV